MKFVALRDLKINPAKVLDRLVNEDMIITRHGKPAAALVYLDEDLLDHFILVHHPTLLKEVESARSEYLTRGGIDHKTMKNRIERRRG